MSTETKWRTDLPSEDGQYIVKIYGGFLQRIWYSRFYNEWDIKGGEKAIDAWLPIEEEDDVVAELEDKIQRLYDAYDYLRSSPKEKIPSIIVCSTNNEKRRRTYRPDSPDVNRGKARTYTNSIVLPEEVYEEIKDILSKKRLEYVEKLHEYINNIK